MARRLAGGRGRCVGSDVGFVLLFVADEGGGASICASVGVKSWLFVGI